MITSDLVTIPNTDEISTEYIENELRKCNIINPLRWALVNSNHDKLTISIAYEK